VKEQRQLIGGPRGGQAAAWEPGIAYYSHLLNGETVYYRPCDEGHLHAFNEVPDLRDGGYIVRCSLSSRFEEGVDGFLFRIMADEREARISRGPPVFDHVEIVADPFARELVGEVPWAEEKEEETPW
jgi:hypothetical protein